MVLALLLAKAGIQAEILEAAAQLDEAPRASHYSYPALRELERAGLLEDIRERGMVTNGQVSWRKLDGTLLAKINSELIPTEHRLHSLPLNKLTKLILEHLARAGVETKWSHKVLAIDQNEDYAELTVETPTGKQTLKADYVVGCDGANSQIRRSLFGDMEFPGRTWDEQIIATNVSLFCLCPHNTHGGRSTTISRNTAGTRAPLSLIQSIGLWLHNFSQTAFFASLTETSQASLEKSTLLVSPKSSKRSYQGIQSLASTS